MEPDTNLEVVQLPDNWSRIKSTLEKESRFYNSNIVGAFTYVFGRPGIYKELYNDPSVVKEVFPDSDFDIFRARDFGSPESAVRALLVPERELARPPARIARAGRMNADGISVFYGAKDKEVALAEIRPPVGSNVVIARFCIARKKIRLLDVEGLRNTYGRYILKGYDKAIVSDFIENFGNQVTVPVVPENESKEYIITQVISDYLSSRTDIDIDGLIYKSAQTGALRNENIVLFHKSSKVEDIEEDKIDSLIGKVNYLIKDIKSSKFDVFDIDALKKMRDSYLGHYNSGEDGDDHEMALKVDINSISLHIVETANFDTNPPIRPLI